MNAWARDRERLPSLLSLEAFALVALGRRRLQWAGLARQWKLQLTLSQERVAAVEVRAVRSLWVHQGGTKFLQCLGQHGPATGKELVPARKGTLHAS
jgi:hypothetical protein